MNFYISETFCKEDVDAIRFSLQSFVKLHHVKFIAVCFHETDPGIFHVHVATYCNLDCILYGVASHICCLRFLRQKKCSLSDYITYCSWCGTIEFLLYSSPSHDCIKRLELDDD